MIWWAIFIASLPLSGLFTCWFVPVEHRRKYHESRKDRTFWLSNILSNGVWVVAAIQNIVAPSSFPWRLRVAGLAALVVGHALVIWAWRVNDLFIPSIEYVPPSWRVRNGPYHFLRHPGYAGFLLSEIGTVCLLGQLWAMVPLGLYIIVILRRIHTEDRVLSGKQFI